MSLLATLELEFCGSLKLYDLDICTIYTLYPQNMQLRTEINCAANIFEK
jgi:hypothetical protein